MNSSGIEIFKTDDGQTQVHVVLENQTVWLNLNQMANLFERDKSVVSRHIKNIFKEEELVKNSVVANFATTAKDGKSYQVEYFNLDVIISVGYRVKSKRGTQFRIWANKILKDFLIKGFSLNEKKLIQQKEQLQELHESVKILGNILKYKELSNDESTGLLRLISDYAYALDTLDRYDYQSLKIHGTSEKEIYQLTYEEALNQILMAKKVQGNGQLFGNEKDDSFKSSISTIYQTFDGNDLYPSIEEKAPNLLYLVTKNHSFTDGNKRIAALLFLYFMERNGILFDKYGNKRIPDNALVALTLMIAVSNPEEKEIMIKVVVNLINQRN